MSETWQVVVEHLLVSPAHAYAGRPADGPAEVATYDRDVVDVVAGKGIVGDRYFGRAAHANAAVTFIAAETFDWLRDGLGLTHDLDPLAARRNVVLRGADVDALAGHDFTIESNGDIVTFAGRRPARPCAWMDVTLAPGAFRAMRGRGGIRSAPLTSGRLHRGPATLTVLS